MHPFTVRPSASTGFSIFWKTPSVPARLATGRPTTSRTAMTVIASRSQWPGFEQTDLDITSQSNLLIVTGKKQETANEGYLHRGIAGRPFQHRFELADHVRVNGADLKNG